MTRASNFGIVFLLSLATGCLGVLPECNGQVEVFVDSVEFSNALTANDFPSQTVNFESVLSGSVFSPPATIQAITFDMFGPPDLVVANDFATTSGLNYLGVAGTGFANQIVGGYEIDLGFPSSRAIGLFIITGEIAGFSIFDNDIQLVVPGSGTVFLDVDSLQATIGGTDSVYFLGLINTATTFSSAQIRYDMLASEAITFNIDDIVTAIDPLLGDVNRDGAVNLLDVEPFVTVLSNLIYQIEADTNQDGAVNLLDVDPFIQILSGG